MVRKKLCDTVEIHDMEYVSVTGGLKKTLLEEHAFRKDLADYAVGSISFAMGFA